MSSNPDAASRGAGVVSLRFGTGREQLQHTYDPVAMAMSDCTEKLHHQRLDFGLQERMRHRFQQSLQIVLDERHDYEDPG